MRFLFLLLCPVVLLAQVPSNPAPNVSFQDQLWAAKQRADLADAVRQKRETPDAALRKLKAQTSPAGLKLAVDANFALAAIDVGQRLVAFGKPAEAEPFFLEADKALDKAVKKAPDGDAQQKTMLLKQLIYLRTQYLGKPAEAEAAIDQALALQPEDKQLKRAKDKLGWEKESRKTRSRDGRPEGEKGKGS